jgi:hypothetical protein
MWAFESKTSVSGCTHIACYVKPCIICIPGYVYRCRPLHMHMVSNWLSGIAVTIPTVRPLVGSASTRNNNWYPIPICLPRPTPLTYLNLYPKKVPSTARHSRWCNLCYCADKVSESQNHKTELAFFSEKDTYLFWYNSVSPGTNF